MSHPHTDALSASQFRSSAGLVQADKTASQTAWTVRRVQPAPRPRLAQRHYDMMWLAPNGDIMDHHTQAPALPVFENAFSSFARGALIPTQHGPIAIEDLLPGDHVETADGDFMPVQWIGSMQLDAKGAPARGKAPETLYRIVSDSFGWGSPAPDLMLGKGARYVHRAQALKSYLGTSEALAPVASLADGHRVIEVTPATSVRTYHICLAQHRLIRVNGFELETYHPGTAASGQLIGTLRATFMTLFPHLTELGDFGAMVHPRLSAGDLAALTSA
ncbi:Hint domain-containing protein [Pacificibacter maritimus]|uniref:Hint domain-containing protein n=1 Tax=Pacificibacter maritimus TaxID=762213 RepID=A0A3N4U6J2_9RHOB|nr:Hint domain-containing protein [Pacificibacter maritimus]RPE66403.1 Hint domain-containing protein [Pacificibacter maritimus]